MSKGRKKVSSVETTVTLDALQQCAKQVRGEYPALAFINLILTEHEKMTLGRRIIIAQMILVGITRMEICDTLHVSPNTVTLTKRWLEEQMPNYSEITSKFETQAAKRRLSRNKRNLSKSESGNTLVFQSLLKKYPAHFLLFNVIEHLFNRLDK